jgi:hypothetical protein
MASFNAVNLPAELCGTPDAVAARMGAGRSVLGRSEAGAEPQMRVARRLCRRSLESAIVTIDVGGSIMSDDIAEFRQRLADLGKRIDAKVEEFRFQGVLHGTARQEAAEFQIEHSRVSKRIGEHASVAGVIADEVTTDVEILKHSFERWIARVDKGSEKG